MTAVDDVVAHAERLASSRAPIIERLDELRRYRPSRLDAAYTRARRGDGRPAYSAAADLLEATIALRSALALQPPAWWQRLEWLLLPSVVVSGVVIAAQLASGARVRPELLLLLLLPALHVLFARRLGSLEVPAVPGHPGRLASLGGEVRDLTERLAQDGVDVEAAAVRTAARVWRAGDDLATLLGALAVAQAEKSVALGAVAYRPYRLDVLGRCRRLLCARLPDGLTGGGSDQRAG